MTITDQIIKNQTLEGFEDQIVNEHTEENIYELCNDTVYKFKDNSIVVEKIYANGIIEYKLEN